MTHSKNPLYPTGIKAQVADINSKNTYLKANASRLGISSVDISLLDTQTVDLNTKQAIVDDKKKRTEIDVANRDVSLEKVKKTMRRIIEYYVAQNPNATAVDIKALNVPVPEPHSPLNPPKDEPGITFSWRSLILYIHFFNIITGKRAKPEGAHELEARIKIGG
jgi:hypothetical protein